MRQAINENRTVQLVLVGLLALVGGFMLLKPKGSESETTAPAPATSGSDAAACAPQTAAPSDPAATGAPAAAPVTDDGAVSGATATAVPAEMVPGPGLPKALLAAYHRGDAIALLIRRAGGIDDALVRSSVELLHGMRNVKVFITRARKIARYSWLTQSVNVSDLPALVVLRPRRLTKGTPTASVSYGFRDSASVVQAVRDGLYRGPTHRPYHP